MRVLIASPIRQKPKILENFLFFLENLISKDLELFYYFIDDNDQAESKRVLKKFYKKYKDRVILKKGESESIYICDEYSHHWNNALIEKVANYKNSMFLYAKENSFDYIFFIDSDILIHPNTLIHLIDRKKDIISEIFWTKWKPDSPLLPQVWLSDEYNLWPAEIKDLREKEIHIEKFLNMLKKPGVYRVGGLGACTLISRRAIEKGVSFSKIYNLSFWGEDRHFCIRAAALGFELFVDTVYPALHLYRDDDLKKVEKFKIDAGLNI